MAIERLSAEDRMIPVLPLIGKVSLGVGALSYAGQLDITVVADGDAYPDVGVFAAGVGDDLRALELAVQSRRPTRLAAVS